MLNVRSRAARAAAWPSAQVVLRTPALAVAALAAAPALVTVARGGHDLRLSVSAAALLGGAAVAFAVDDPAAATLAASPTPLHTRLAVRVFPIAAVVVVAWLIVAWSAHRVGFALGPLGPRAAEAAAATGLAVAAAHLPARHGEPGGLTGAVAALVIPATATLLAQRYHWLPTLGRADHVLRWWGVAAVAWLAAAWVTRDPAARKGGLHGVRRCRYLSTAPMAG